MLNKIFSTQCFSALLCHFYLPDSGTCSTKTCEGVSESLYTLYTLQHFTGLSKSNAEWSNSLSFVNSEFNSYTKIHKRRGQAKTVFVY